MIAIDASVFIDDRETARMRLLEMASKSQQTCRTFFACLACKRDPHGYEAAAALYHWQAGRDSGLCECPQRETHPAVS